MKTINLDRPGIRANCRPEFLQGFTDQGHSLDAVPYGVAGHHVEMYANADEFAICVALMVASLPDDERYHALQHMKASLKEC